MTEALTHYNQPGMSPNHRKGSTTMSTYTAAVATNDGDTYTIANATAWEVDGNTLIVTATDGVSGFRNWANITMRRNSATTTFDPQPLVKALERIANLAPQ